MTHAGPRSSLSAVSLLLPLLLLAVGLLAGCGKKGAPSAPGPQGEVIFPHSYPTR